MPGEGNGDGDFYGDFGPPTGETPSLFPEVAAAVRYALTGDFNSPTPTGAIIDYPARRAIRDLIQANPCTGELSTLEPSLTGADLEYFYEAAGYAVALSLLNTPQAAQYARTLVKVKIGPVEETTEDGVVIETARTWLTAEYDKALGSIGCVAAGRQAAMAGGIGLFALAGRRRAIEERCGRFYNGYNGYRRRL